MRDEGNDLSRRRLVALGALGGATLLGGGAATGTSAVAVEDSDPGGPRLGGPLVGGYSYVYRQYYDFAPADNSSYTYLNGGIFGDTQPKLSTAIELPFGALLWSVEFYLQTTVDVTVEAALWRTQTSDPAALTTAEIASKSSEVATYAIGIPDAKRGPYAPGSMLLLAVQNTSTNTRLNGARVGYTRGPAGVVMLDKPVRAYDSRTGGGAKIGNGQTRIHSLASLIPAGATSAIVNLTVTGGEKSGGVALYSAGTTVPSGSAIYWTTATVSNQLHTKLTSDRKVKVTMRGVSGSKVHYFFDVVGYAV